VVDPSTVLNDYAPTLSDEQTAELSLESPDDALLLVVAHPADGGVCVNLLAPVVANRTTGTAAQVILEGQDYPLRAPLS
jgi:flagellar assembly factor FliW